ncbi:hypothetical protein Hanom_Chr08g00727221 [Helianthus anomalus]
MKFITLSKPEQYNETISLQHHSYYRPTNDDKEEANTKRNSALSKNKSNNLKELEWRSI